MNLTQVAGLVAFGCASVACFMARSPRLWQALGALHALLVLEMLLGFRHTFHDYVDAGLRSVRAYEGRGDWQWMLLAAVLVLVTLAGLWAVKTYRWTAGLRGAFLLSLAAVMLFAIESVSLHSVDAVLYRSLDGVMMIGWLWLAIGAGVVCCALYSRAGPTSGRSGARRRRKRR